MIFLTIEKILCFNDCLDNLYNFCWEKLHHVCRAEGWSRGGEFLVSLFVQFFNTCISKQITMRTSVLASSFWLSYCSNEGMQTIYRTYLTEKIMIVSTKGADCTVIYFSGIWAISVKDICVKIFQGFIFLDFDHP